MPIAHDAVSSGYDASGTATSLTVSHICTGENRILFAAVRINSTSDLVIDVTYNGVAMTRVSMLAYTSNYRFYLYILVNPAEGTHNVITSTSSGVTITNVNSSYTGAAQSGQPDAQTTGTATAATTFNISNTSIADNCWTLCCFMNFSGNGIAPGTGTTQRIEDISGIVGIYDSNGPKTPAGSVTLQATAGSGDWGGLIASLSPYTLATNTGNFFNFL